MADNKQKTESNNNTNEPRKIFVASSSKSQPLAEKVSGILEEIDDAKVTPWWKIGVFSAGQITLNEMLKAASEHDGGIFVLSEKDCISENNDNEKDVKVKESTDKDDKSAKVAENEPAKKMPVFEVEMF